MRAGGEAREEVGALHWKVFSARTVPRRIRWRNYVGGWVCVCASRQERAPFGSKKKNFAVIFLCFDFILNDVNNSRAVVSLEYAQCFKAKEELTDLVSSLHWTIYLSFCSFSYIGVC